MHETIASLVANITPGDEFEREHMEVAGQWIASGAPLWRIRKPDDPPIHLVSYFAVCDVDVQRLLLVDHKLAGLWLPSGGHVEIEEHPQTTVVREMREELGADAVFLLNEPLFLTVTQTVGQDGGHTDVSLWYVLRGDSTQTYAFDSGEFHRIAWFPLAELPLHRSDPHLGRFAMKLRAYLQQ